MSGKLQTKHPANTLDKQARSEDFREYRRSSSTCDIDLLNLLQLQEHCICCILASQELPSCLQSSAIRFLQRSAKKKWLCALEAACLNKACSQS